MGEREMLERAAKAAGLWDAANNCIDIPWNPLIDDGDALRLAVKLQIWIRWRDDNTVSASWYDERGIFAGNVNEGIGSLRNGDEPNAAVRRCIVRAAASLTPAPEGERA
ncbi:hypothetical protein [Variovorax sp.]|jgi:hypothetical protein|uniref:hypothetical protein n=1 Tax=Variovorax sp. TaxID=1871043 RepID=UPI0040384414